MQTLLAIQLHNRKVFHHYLKHFSLEQLNTIPRGFNNNILWNIAHTMVTHQLLTYKRSGQNMTIPREWVGYFAKDTRPERDFTTEEVKAIDTALFTTNEQFETDVNNGIFADMKPYTTSTNMVLDSIEATQSFVLFHDGIHLGSILALAKLV